MSQSTPNIFTSRPDGTGRFYLEELGGVAGIHWSDTMPGGSELLACTIAAEPNYRHEALNPGRRVCAVRGGSIAWEGTLAEPSPGDTGWTITANGAGTWGNNYRAIWSTWSAAGILDPAISRGLRWLRGNTSGADLSQVNDSGSISVQDFMNLITTPISQSWRVKRVQAGLSVDVITLPTTPTRLLVSTTPAVRTINGYVNALYDRYQITADNGNKKATFGLGSSVNQASINKHDRLEAYWDVSNVGNLTSSAANALDANALLKYVAASYAGPFTVGPGDYLTMGGAEVDLATEKAGEVVQMILADGPYGGEVTPSPPVRWPVGKFEYDDDTGTGIVTPYSLTANDFGNLLTAIAPKAPA